MYIFPFADQIPIDFVSWACEPTPPATPPPSDAWSGGATAPIELVAGAAEWAEEAGAANGGSGEDEPATLLERYLTQAVLVTPADGAAEDAVTFASPAIRQRWRGSLRVRPHQRCASGGA